MNALRILVALPAAFGVACSSTETSLATSATEVANVVSPSTAAAPWPALRGRVDSALHAIERQPAAQSLANAPDDAKRLTALVNAFQSAMTEMNMSCDTRMAALTDSVLRDADRLPGMTLVQYRRVLPAHVDRVRRLLEAQRLMGQFGM